MISLGVACGETLCANAQQLKHKVEHKIKKNLSIFISVKVHDVIVAQGYNCDAKVQLNLQTTKCFLQTVVAQCLSTCFRHLKVSSP